MTRVRNRIFVGLISLILLLSFIIAFSNKSSLGPYQSSYSLIDAFPSLSFTRPVDFQDPDDGRDEIFVVEQAGRIVRFDNDNLTNSVITYLDITARVNSGASEQGLLGLAFSPYYATDGYFFVSYTADSTSRVSRFTHDVNTQLADPTSELVIIEIDQPYANHNGGQIAFGSDGMLYIGWGDGGSAGDPFTNGQNPNTLLGSILRIDVFNQDNGLNYAIPLDNPFFGKEGYREEIYAYGLRNPWRFSFDVVTNELWAADVGQNLWEEVDRVIAGGNYGWNTMEGNHCYSPSTNCDQAGLILPVFDYDRSMGYSVTGGYVYRGEQNPGLYGKYIFGDYGSGRIWSITDDNFTQLILESGQSISSFGTDEANELYILSFDGHIYSILESGYIPTEITTSTTTETILITTIVSNETTVLTSINTKTTTITPNTPPTASNSVGSNKSSSNLNSPMMSLLIMTMIGMTKRVKNKNKTAR